MTQEWQQTNQIYMALRSAELSLPGFGKERRLNLSCKLVNIARGTCNIEIEAAQSGAAETGQLQISIDRPVMNATLVLARDRFDDLLDGVSRAGTRPTNITLSIAEQLAVSIEGDLNIDQAKDLAITDIAIAIPLK
jgi:hypothetical protein